MAPLAALFFQIKNQEPEILGLGFYIGAENGDRTHDLHVTSVLLYQLSYLGNICAIVSERVSGIEPPSPAWEAGIITTIRYPQFIYYKGNDCLKSNYAYEKKYIQIPNHFASG